MAITTTGPDDEGTSTGEAYLPSEDATDQCALAPGIGAGRHYGSLRGNASELDGACGLDGPDAFFRLEVPRRSDVWLQGVGVGFVPRIGVLPHTCTTDWTHRTVACTEGVGTWVLDVAEGSSMVVSVGIDADHPAIQQPPPMEGDDPLDFAVDVGLRNVLEVGEACEPAGRGRCGSGTACIAPPPPADDPEAPPGEAVCTVLAGDTCQTAVPLSVSGSGVAVQIEPSTLQTDAHAHSCGGARQRERVLRLLLPVAVDEVVGLDLRSDHPEVGLAVRAPGCLPDHELGCVDPSGASPASLVVEVTGPEAFLFIELPPADDEIGGSETTGEGPTGEEAPIAVTIDLFDPVPAP